jgi:hypothetical protein
MRSLHRSLDRYNEYLESEEFEEAMRELESELKEMREELQDLRDKLD